jgi:hypothetical protein
MPLETSEGSELEHLDSGAPTVAGSRVLRLAGYKTEPEQFRNQYMIVQSQICNPNVLCQTIFGTRTDKHAAVPVAQ